MAAREVGREGGRAEVRDAGARSEMSSWIMLAGPGLTGWRHHTTPVSEGTRQW